MFPVVGDASTGPDRLPDLSRFDVLVEDKVWQHLGLTLKEFLAQEAEGAHADDRRPEVVGPDEPHVHRSLAGRRSHRTA